MAKPISDLERKMPSNVGWLLILLLVAGSSFLIGSSLHSPASSSDTNPSTQTSSAAIDEISQTLDPTSVTPSFDPTAPPPASPTVNGLVSINTSTETELETLPGIGPSKAKAIIDYRQTNGPFVTLEDLEKVKGIGPKTFASLKAKISL